MIIATLELQRRFDSVATLQRFGSIIAQRQFRIGTMVKAQSFARMVLAKPERQHRSKSIATLQRFRRIIAQRQPKSFAQSTLPTTGAQTDDGEAFTMAESIMWRIISGPVDDLQLTLGDLKARVNRMGMTAAGKPSDWAKIASDIKFQRRKMNSLGEALDDHLPMG